MRRTPKTPLAWQFSTRAASSSARSRENSGRARAARDVLGGGVMINRTIPLFATGLFLLAACDHQDTTGSTITPATTTRTTSGSTLAAPVDGHAIDELAAARCDREQTCNNVGNNKSYATRDVCVQKLRADGQNDLTNGSCPNGISRLALDKCLADIRGERCDHPLDTLSRLNSCARASLCP